ncbi:MAG: glycine--tRNA ligase subunit alpha, partial [Alkalibacterium sp.]
LGCAGLGWEVWLDGMEVTQFTYFQQVGGLEVDSVTSELTYGLERLASYIQDVNSVYDIEWAPGVKYGEIFKHPEYEHSAYSFDHGDTAFLFSQFSAFEKEALKQIENNLVHPAYDYVLKCSHAFNLLDARGAVSATDRPDYLKRIRHMARLIAKAYLEERAKLSFPLIKDSETAKWVEKYGVKEEK